MVGTDVRHHRPAGLKLTSGLHGQGARSAHTAVVRQCQTGDTAFRCCYLPYIPYCRDRRYGCSASLNAMVLFWTYVSSSCGRLSSATVKVAFPQALTTPVYWEC